MGGGAGCSAAVSGAGEMDGCYIGGNEGIPAGGFSG